MNKRLNISHIAYPVTALGPGHRIVIWTAGCPLKCKECITPQLQDKNNGKLIDINKLAQKIVTITKHSKKAISGVTLTGGEPFIQPLELADLWLRLKKSRPDWNLLVFSGYQHSQLQHRTDARVLLQLTDILIDGPYLPDQATKRAPHSNSCLTGNHPLLASVNQQVHYLSSTGKQLQQQCQSLPKQAANLGIGKSDQAWLIGIIDKQKRNKIHQLYRTSP